MKTVGRIWRSWHRIDGGGVNSLRPYVSLRVPQELIDCHATQSITHTHTYTRLSCVVVQLVNQSINQLLWHPEGCIGPQ